VNSVKRLRCAYRLEAKRSNNLHRVFRKEDAKVIGHLCERHGKGGGWWYRPIGREKWSSEQFKSSNAAIVAMAQDSSGMWWKL
jgi:hypothetical protein